MALTDFDHFVLRHVPKAGNAYWTGDIASDCQQPTARVQKSLERLARHKLVRNVVVGAKGLPSSWEVMMATRGAGNDQT